MEHRRPVPEEESSQGDLCHLWGLTLAAPFSVLPMLAVPGVRLDMFLTEGVIVRMIGAWIGGALWCWYLCVSVRVKNTLVNQELATGLGEQVRG
ncbi:hypothetical protein RSO01_75860 [Reyranella soli]|uniref:Uncharacterized protein n=1 Tax=Reyranella soli TaxID=1230389 RepID=A0A512NNA5_9HYPH|nr:hypothetical protein RSO01_75860 [Reyranella soli]